MKRLIFVALVLLCSNSRAQQPAVESGVNLSAYAQHATGHRQPTIGAFVQAIERRGDWAFIERVELTNARKLYAKEGHAIKLEGVLRYYVHEFFGEGSITHSFATIDTASKSATAFGLGAGYNFKERAILGYAHRFADSTLNRTSADQIKVEFRENFPNDSRLYGKLKIGYSRVRFYQPFGMPGKHSGNGAEIEGGLGFRF